MFQLDFWIPATFIYSPSYQQFILQHNNNNKQSKGLARKDRHSGMNEPKRLRSLYLRGIARLHCSYSGQSLAKSIVKGEAGIFME